MAPEAVSSLRALQPGRSDAAWWRLTWAVVLAASGLRLWLALVDHSIYWPDEIYQSLEQAHRVAFGSGIIPWEFRDGARSWILPGLIAGLWRAAAAVGVESSLTLVGLARAGVVAASGAALWLSARLATRLGSAQAGFVAAIVLGVLPMSVVFGYRTMSETVSAPLLALGALCLLQRSARSAAWAGAWVTLATLLRYQNGLVVMAFALWLLAQRRRRDAYLFCGAAAAAGVAGGMLDWATWGRPFHSLLTYVDFNLVQGGASTFGVEPFWYYATSLWNSTGPALLLFGLLAMLGARRAPALALTALGYLLVHSLIPHKELRFVVPALPFCAVVAGLGAEQLYQRLARHKAAWWVALGAASTGATFRLTRLTYGRMGQYLDTPRAERRIWNADEDANLLLADAGRQADLCGMGVLGLRAAFTGGYTYLHRSVPLLYANRLCGAEPAVNYLLVPNDLAEELLPGGYERTSARGPLGLFRRSGGCEPLPSALDALLEGAHDMGLQRPMVEQAPDGGFRFDLLRHSGAFESGWGHGEIIDCEPARWAVGHRSEVQFRAAVTGGAYTLHASLQSPSASPDQHLKLSLNDLILYEGELASPRGGVHADIPPEALHRGFNQLVFEFSKTWRAGGDDTRDLAALLRSLDIRPLTDDFDIDVGSPSDADHLLSGFSGNETDGTINFAWSEGTVSEVQGSLLHPSSKHVLILSARAIEGTTGRTQILVNHRPLSMVRFTPEWTHPQLLVPPELLRAGQNRIRFEYEATITPASLYPASTDQRSLSVSFDRIQLAPLQPVSVIDFGTPQGRAGLLEGWSGDEMESGRSVLWSVGTAARMSIWLLDTREARLEIDARAYPPAMPVRVEVWLDGSRIGSFSPGAAWQTHSLVLPARGAFADRPSRLEFRFDRTARPSEHEPGSLDRRELAVRFDAARIVR